MNVYVAGGPLLAFSVKTITLSRGSTPTSLAQYLTGTAAAYGAAQVEIATGTVTGTVKIGDAASQPDQLSAGTPWAFFASGIQSASPVDLNTIFITTTAATDTLLVRMLRVTNTH